MVEDLHINNQVVNNLLLGNYFVEDGDEGNVVMDFFNEDDFIRCYGLCNVVFN